VKGDRYMNGPKYCKKVDTGVVYVSSPELLKRSDMVVCDENGNETVETKKETIVAKKEPASRTRKVEPQTVSVDVVTEPKEK
jgi:hypothetical protein